MPSMDCVARRRLNVLQVVIIRRQTLCTSSGNAVYSWSFVIDVMMGHHHAYLSFG